jgi:undecaprenyl-diphosphatase
MSVPEQILHLDYALMLKINKQWTAPWLDTATLFARESYLYVPFYLFLALFMILNFGSKGAWWVVVALSMAGLCDIMSSKIIKEIFDRPRPCRDPFMGDQIRFIAKYCGMNGSFISSHASNHFAAAMFIFQTLKWMDKKWGLVFGWAAAICYAQVYVGVHYPSDVLAGAGFGCLVGALTARFFNRKMGLETSNA